MQVVTLYCRADGGDGSCDSDDGSGDDDSGNGGGDGWVNQDGARLLNMHIILFEIFSFLGNKGNFLAFRSL